MRGRVVRLTTAEGPIELGIDAGGRWCEPGAGSDVVDLRHQAAFPGLVDAHAHLGASSITDMIEKRPGALGRVRRHAADQLAAGVLLLTDKGTDRAETVAFALDLAESDRPDLQLAGGFLANRDGYYAELAQEVEPEDLAAAVAAYGPQLASWVKLIGDWPRPGRGAVTNFDESALRAAVEAAHRAGRRVAIHTAAPDTPGAAVRAGVDSIEHGLFLTTDDIAMLGERHGAWVPTIAAMEALADGLRAGSSGRSLILEGLANVGQLLTTAVAAGVRVLVGTDLVLRHGEVVEEAARLVAYGLVEEDAVAALTTAPRSFLDRPGFTAGHPADFLTCDQPGGLRELAAPRLVVRCGRTVVSRLPCAV